MKENFTSFKRLAAAVIIVAPTLAGCEVSVGNGFIHGRIASDHGNTRVSGGVSDIFGGVQVGHSDSGDGISASIGTKENRLMCEATGHVDCSVQTEPGNP